MKKKMLISCVMLFICLVIAFSVASITGTPVCIETCTHSCLPDDLYNSPVLVQLREYLAPLLPESLSGCVETPPQSPWTYSPLADGTVELTGYSGTQTELSIPAELDGFAVTRIGDHTFDSNQTIESVIVPEGVTSIGDHAFKLCNIREVTLPDGLVSIGGGAFSYCELLTDINLPDSIHEIGSSAFYYCSSLTALTLPEGITEISDNLLGNCWQLAELTIPDSVAVIGYGAFYRCYALPQLVMPVGVTTIRGAAFAECTSLLSVTVLCPDAELGSELFLGGNSSVALYGISGSTAEAYAAANDIPFLLYNPQADA